MTTYTDAQRVQDARQRIAEARQALSTVGKTYAEAVRSVRSAVNANAELSREGKAQAERDGIARARSEADAQLASIRGDITSAEASLQRIANDAPRPDADAVARQGVHWRRAESLLAAGRTVPDLLRSETDPDALAALRAELPTYLAAQTQRPRGIAGAGWSEPDMSRVLLAVDRRIAEVGSGADAAAAAAARVAAAADLPVAQVHIDGVSREVSGHGSSLQTAIGVAQAEQSAAQSI